MAAVLVAFAMAVSSTVTLSQYVGNSSTASPYPTGFPFLDSSHLRVQVMDAGGVVRPLTEELDYLVTGAGHPVQGEIRTAVAYDDTHTITILRRTPVTQLLNLLYNDRLPAGQMETALDKLTLIVQELSGGSAVGNRSIQFPYSEPSGNPTVLPVPVNRRGSLLYFDETKGEMQVLRLDQLAQRLLNVLGVETLLPYRVREITAEAYALEQEDVNTSLRVNTAGGTIITLGETSNFADAFFCSFSRFGNGSVEFAAPPGVVIESDGNKKRIFGQKTEVVCQVIGVNRWWIRGDLY